MGKIKMILIAVVVVALGAAAGVAGVTAVGLLTNPDDTSTALKKLQEAGKEKTKEDIVWDAFANTFLDGETELTEALHMSERASALSGKPVEYGFTLGLDTVNAELLEMMGLISSYDTDAISQIEGFGLSLNGEVDLDALETWLKAEISYGDIGVDLETYLSEEKILLGSSLLGTNVLALNLDEDLLEQMKASPLLSAYAQEISQEDASVISGISDQLKDCMDSMNSLISMVGGYTESDELLTFRDSIKVEETEEASLSYRKAGELAEVSAQGYELTLASSDLADFIIGVGDSFISSTELNDFLAAVLAISQESYDLEQGMDEMKAGWEESKEAVREEIEGLFDELSVNVYVYDDLIVGIEFQFSDEKLTEGDTMKVTYYNYGGSSAFSDCTFAMELGGVKASLICEEETEGSTVTESMSVSYEQESYSMNLMSMDTSYDTSTGELSLLLDVAGYAGLSFGGYVTENTTDAFAMEDMELSLNIYGSPVCSLSGEVYFGEHSGAVSQVEGTVLDIMTMTEDDMLSLYDVLMDNVGSMEGIEYLLEEMFS